MKRSAAEVAEIPFGVCTVISTVPTGAAGEIAVIDVGLFKRKLVAVSEPNQTAVAPARFNPVIVTGVPPVESPLVTLNPETTGAGET